MATLRPSSTAAFSTYPLEKLLLLWKNDEVTADQMIGYLLLNVIELEQRILLLERSAPASDRSTPTALRS